MKFKYFCVVLLLVLYSLTFTPSESHVHWSQDVLKNGRLPTINRFNITLVSQGSQRSLGPISFLSALSIDSKRKRTLADSYVKSLLDQIQKLINKNPIVTPPQVLIPTRPLRRSSIFNFVQRNVNALSQVYIKLVENFSSNVVTFGSKFYQWALSHRRTITWLGLTATIGYLGTSVVVFEMLGR